MQDTNHRPKINRVVPLAVAALLLSVPIWAIAFLNPWSDGRAASVGETPSEKAEVRLQFAPDFKLAITQEKRSHEYRMIAPDDQRLSPRPDLSRLWAGMADVSELLAQNAGARLALQQLPGDPDPEPAFGSNYECNSSSDEDTIEMLVAVLGNLSSQITGLPITPVPAVPLAFNTGQLWDCLWDYYFDVLGGGPPGGITPPGDSTEPGPTGGLGGGGGFGSGLGGTGGGSGGGGGTRGFAGERDATPSEFDPFFIPF